MSAETLPISSSRFAQAIEDLPLENVYAKAHEIHNSIAHLEKSNAQLLEYSNSIRNDTSLDENTRAAGDKDCLEAIGENQLVIERQLTRVRLLQAEVERRGGKWHEGGTTTNGVLNGNRGQSESDHDAVAVINDSTTTRRLTDEELRQGLEEQRADDEEGMHL